MESSGRPGWTRFDGLVLAASTLLPALLAGAGLASETPASHDDGVVRVVGLGWTGLFRGLEAMLGAMAFALPLGTRALRAGVVSAGVAAACGALTFGIARGLTHAAFPRATSPRLTSVACGVAALAATLSPVWQVEASAPAGSVVGAAIILSGLARAQREARGSDARTMALLLGLAVSYEPLVLLATIAAVGPWVAPAVRRRFLCRRTLVDAAPAFVMGLVPIAFAALLRTRTPEVALTWAGLFASPFGEGDRLKVGIRAFASLEIGAVVLMAATVGVFVAARAKPARVHLASAAAVVAVGLLALVVGAPSGPAHVSAVVLAATAALHAIAALALTAVVLAIRQAPVPLAQASASLVLLLELVIPVQAADDTSTRRGARFLRASTLWNEIAWGTAPPAAVVLVSQEALMRRIAAARATGAMRADLLVVPTFASSSRTTAHALRAEPKLTAIYRDLALGSTPEELSLATLATERPTLATFEPLWDRSLARHFVPLGLLTKFEPEPRGDAERRAALEAFASGKRRLLSAIVLKPDVDLARTTAHLLRARAIGMATCGDREVLSRALDDLRPFAPDDQVATQLVRRLITRKGAIDVRDLAP